jgi:hypothetical protein
MEMEEKLDGFHLKNHYKDHILQFYDEVNRNGNAAHKTLKHKSESSGVSLVGICLFINFLSEVKRLFRLWKLKNIVMETKWGLLHKRINCVLLSVLCII